MPDLELSLLNSLKVLFSGLGAKNSDNNYAVPLFSKSDATPVGFMNLSDLASVLGVFTYQTLTFAWENLKTHNSGVYAVRSAAEGGYDQTGLPNNATNSAFIIFFRSSSVNYFQLALFVYGSAVSTEKKLCYNIFRSSWGEWKEIATV